MTADNTFTLPEDRSALYRVALERLSKDLEAESLDQILDRETEATS